MADIIDPRSAKGQQMIRNAAFESPGTQGDPPPEEYDERTLTVRGLVDELSRMATEHDLWNLPVYDIDDNPIQTVIWHDPNGDGTECHVSVEPQ